MCLWEYCCCCCCCCSWCYDMHVLWSCHSCGWRCSVCRKCYCARATGVAVLLRLLSQGPHARLCHLLVDDHHTKQELWCRELLHDLH